VSDVLGAEQSLGESLLEGRAHRRGTVVLEQLVQLMDVPHPQPRPPVRQLGEVLQGGPSELEQMLALQIPLGAPSGDGGDELGAVLGQQASSGRRLREWKRRLLVRWEYYASNFLGFVQLGCCISEF
jgi:hypothetical protein